MKTLVSPLAAALAAFSLIGLVGPAVAQQARFLSVIEDVPLAPTLEERADSLAEIDGPDGRIVSIQARGPVEPAALTAFYDQSLPALGWARDGAVFVRQRARLAITFRRDGDGLIVTYRLVERPASLRLE